MRFKKVIITLLTLIFVSVNFIGCTANQFSDVLDEETELSIKTGYVNYCVKEGYIPDITVSDVIIKNFYGIYNGSAVVEISGDLWPNLPVIKGWFRVAGIDFAYEGAIMTVYNSGQRYWLLEAYEMGLLSKKDLKNINEKHKNINPDLYLNPPMSVIP